MPYARQRPRIAAAGRATIRLSAHQRDLFLGNPSVPRALAFALKNAAVRDGKLSIRVTGGELDRLIAAAARIVPRHRAHERELNSLLNYLEAMEDRFEAPPE